MKNYIGIFVFLCLSITGFSQKYGNEWINYSQKYYSFYIASNGVFKLDYNTIRASGIDVKSFTSENIQIIGREREVPIYIVDGGDNKLDSGDYILFHAKHNDAW
jgi:hypothetical protein